MVGRDGPVPVGDRVHDDTVAGPYGMGPSRCSHLAIPHTRMRTGTVPPFPVALCPPGAAPTTPPHTHSLHTSPVRPPASPGRPPVAHGCIAVTAAP